jgi:hypothetical protein
MNERKICTKETPLFEIERYGILKNANNLCDLTRHQ